MARLNSEWFEFAGIKSTDMGVRMMDPHVRGRGEWRGKSLTASGRSGDYWRTDGAYETITIKRQLRVPGSQLDSVAAWLTGSGRLRFSYQGDRAYDARISKAIEFKRTVPGTDPLFDCDVTFVLQPFARLYPEAENIVITASGTAIPGGNPGTAPSLPRVKITGSGDFSLTIGIETIFFSDVTDGIIVDSERMDALSYDGLTLANDHMGGTPFSIQPGYNVVSWMLEDGASISKVEITPRWRYI